MHPPQLSDPVSPPESPPRPCQPPSNGATTLQEALEGSQSPVRAPPDAQDDHATQVGPNVCRDWRDGVKDGTPRVLGLAGELPKTLTPPLQEPIPHPPPGQGAEGTPPPCHHLPASLSSKTLNGEKQHLEQSRSLEEPPNPLPLDIPMRTSPVAPRVSNHLQGSEAPPRSTPRRPHSPSTPSPARAARCRCTGMLQPLTTTHPHPGGCGWRDPAGRHCCR